MAEKQQETKEPISSEESATPENTETEPEEGGGEEESEKENNSNPFLSPEGFIMMGVAGFLDLFGLIDLIPGIGTALSYIPDVLGLAIISSWTLFRSQTIKMTSGTAEKLKKTGLKMADTAKQIKKAKWLKKLKWIRILAPIGEFIPIVGIAPLWLVAVYFELKG